MKKYLRYFVLPFMATLFWTLVTRLSAIAQDAPEEAEEGAPLPDLDPQLTEGAEQITEAVDKLGWGDIPFVTFFITLGATFVVSGFVYFILFAILRAIFRGFKSDLPLVALGTSRAPATLVVFVLGTIVTFHTLPAGLDENIFVQALGKFLTAAAVMAVVYWIVQILIKVVLYAVRRYAEETEAVWDEVIIPFVEATGPTVIYLVGLSIALQTVGIDLTGLWVTFGGAAFVLGFAVKDILSDFFSGLVLLIDTPFRFGDVVLFEGQRAIIRKIGLRTTKLYLIDSHSDVYIPNTSMHSQSLVNLSRPTSHYYYTIKISLPDDVDPQRASRLIKDVVMAHPDTLGDNNHKLEVIDKYFGFSDPQVNTQEKLEAGRIRVAVEEDLNQILGQVEDKSETLTQKIKRLEQGGLDNDEIKVIKDDFLSICQIVGLTPQTQKGGLRGEYSVLEEDKSTDTDSMITAVRKWYQAWLKDPDLIAEDREALPVAWEQRITQLKRKFSNFYRTLLNPEGDETRLDDFLEEIDFWLRDSFKTTRNEWQNPKVWFDENYTVKFYIDDIALEHGQRGDRIQSEVRREVIWHLRRAYLLR